MLSIRLSRVGKTKQPSYRLIVVEKSKDPFGTYLEQLGFYNPRTNPKTIQLNAERIKYWIGKGAQPSDTIHNLLVDAKIIDQSKVKTVNISKRRAEKLGLNKPKETPAAVPPAEAKPAPEAATAPAENTPPPENAAAPQEDIPPAGNIAKT
ncbi:MAG: 30S ribosomal protein S16 [Patescibacteria group bacterium]|nr:30S ribosomal protein S16 [Patescibacteria group bacterium]MDD5490882.1 30S ribosomal protein S16 [Patescibacteria group bacterium]